MVTKNAVITILEKLKIYPASTVLLDWLLIRLESSKIMNFSINRAGHNHTNGFQQDGRLRSSQCKQAQLQSRPFQSWARLMHEDPTHMHRKLWEYCYIAEALHERGMLAPRRRGLGFAVGREPLSALFASLGCDIVATDLPVDDARTTTWIQTNQYADSLEKINRRGICDDGLFRKRVTFRSLDMRELPDDLGKFDFIWSACSLEHLGTMALGEKFIYESLKYLGPGGVAVHTTEFNIWSDLITTIRGPNVLFRKRDFKRIARNLHQRGYKTDFDFSRGDLPFDRMADKPPYGEKIHLRLIKGPYVVTSFGLIIES